MSAHPFPPLSPLEARALAVLVEKERTVPDTYPLTLNALTAGCNQRSSRNPVFDASESEVQAAIDTLRRYSLVIESSGGRVMRYSQNAKRVLEIPSQSLALLATLVLRGPQTAGELRINSERLHRFSDISAVEGFLHEMADRPAGALVAELPRQPGTRETRWMHLLGEAPPFAVPAAAPETTGASSVAAAARGDGAAAVAASPLPASDAGALHARIAAVELEVAQLRSSIESLCAELGLPMPSLRETGQADERAGG